MALPIVKDSLENYMLPCHFKQATGVDCPGCGMQRSIAAAVRGNFAESFAYYPSLGLIVALFVFLILHLRFQFKQGANYLVVLFCTTAGALLVQYLFTLT